MEYKFEEGQEDKPADERVIEKTGHVIKFTFVEMKHDVLTYEKTLKELKGNRELKNGIIVNMDQHHPFIKDMSEFDRYAVHMYQEAWASRKAYDDKIAQIEAEFEDYKAEIALLEEKFPELKAIPSPYVSKEQCAECKVLPEGEVTPGHDHSGPKSAEEVEPKNPDAGDAAPESTNANNKEEDTNK